MNIFSISSVLEIEFLLGCVELLEEFKLVSSVSVELNAILLWGCYQDSYRIFKVLFLCYWLSHLQLIFIICCGDMASLLLEVAK